MLSSILLFVVAARLVAADETADVGPALTCDLTTFSCPGTGGGCCPIGGCCGSGCCPLGYSCINEGKSDETCCLGSDPTQCGTIDPDKNSSGDGSHSDSGACLGIDNCPRDPERGLAWTCLLGETCGLSYNECYPCVPKSGGGTSSSDDTKGSNGSNTSNDDDPSSSDSSDSSNDDSGGSDDKSGDDSKSDSDKDKKGKGGDPDAGSRLFNAHSTLLGTSAIGIWAIYVLVL